MREILFRGKSAESGKWLYGWVFGEKAKSIIEIDTKYVSEHGVEAYYTSVVIPETVGQYTGLKDKNGVKIFEGDILDKQSYWGWYVKFEEGAFRQVPLRLVQRINWEHHVVTQYNSKDWEVIGNIYEHNHLLR